MSSTPPPLTPPSPASSRPVYDSAARTTRYHEHNRTTFKSSRPVYRPRHSPSPRRLMALQRTTGSSKLAPDVNRILWVKNLNYKTRGDDLYDLFGKYGGIRQIRLGNEPKTRGTAFVVFEDVLDAKNAFDHLNGFHLQERYLVVLYHQASKQASKTDVARREKEVAEQKKKYNISEAE